MFEKIPMMTKSPASLAKVKKFDSLERKQQLWVKGFQHISLKKNSF